VEALELCDRGCVLEPGRVVLAALETRSWPPRAFSAPTWVPTVDTRLVALTRTVAERHNRPVHDSTHLKRPAR